MAVKDMYIVHLKPDQTKSVLERIGEWGGTKRASRTIYNIPSTYTGVETRFLNRIPHQNKIL